MPGDAGFSSKPIISTERPEAKLDEAYASSKAYMDDVEVRESAIRLHYNGDEGLRLYKSVPRYDQADNAGKKYSVFQEALTHYGIENAQWFGDEFRALDFSDYDDKANGYDVVAVVRGQDAEGDPALKTKLGIDLTTGEDDFQDKFESIAYKVDEFPGLMKYQFCIDPASRTYGAQQIPQVACRYSQEDLDTMMAAWKDRTARSEALRTSPVPMRLMTQALIQAAYFGKQLEDGKADRIRADYRISAQYLKDALTREIIRQKKVPRGTADSLVEMMADVRRCDPDLIRSYVLPKEKRETRPVLGQLIWGKR